MNLRVYHPETEVFLEGIEIPIAVQQAMSGFQAETCYEAIDGLAHGMAASPQEPVVLRGGHRSSGTPSIEHVEF